jgi:hypothetical protein
MRDRQFRLDSIAFGRRRTVDTDTDAGAGAASRQNAFNSG